MDEYQIGKQMKELLGDFYGPAAAVVKILAIILVSLLVVKAGSAIIRKIFNKSKHFKGVSANKKADTMASLLSSIFRYAVYIIGLVIILTDVLKMTSVLAAAGIGGIALGFGAQSLIKDLISGFFIVFEDQYAVGDLVTIEGMNGTVEELELRVTKLRNFSGDLYIIPNGEIKKVVNHTRGNRTVVVDIPVAYSSDTEKALEAASRACVQAMKQYGAVIAEEPKVIGITQLGQEAIHLQVVAKTFPNEQWGVERGLRRLIRLEFEKDGIEFFDRNRFVVEKTSGEGMKNG